MLFRAIPPATPVVQPAGDQPKGVQFKLTPVYGVTIPVIVRLGSLQATAGIANVHLETKDGSPVIGLDVMREGSRSTYGEIRVLKAGVKDPIAIQKGVAVYTEVAKRHVSVTIPASLRGAASGSVTVEYLETYDDGTHLLAETQAVLR
jgi:hypothetical protein